MVLPQKWYLIKTDKIRVEKIKKEFNFSTTFSKVLIERGIKTEKEIEKFLAPSIESLHSPSLLPDIEVAFERTDKAIRNGEKILIWGDEDTDGITATVFTYELLKNLNANVIYHIPNRKDEGIGLNIPGIIKAAEMGVKLIITVDCASSDGEEIEEAKKMGIDVIVTDHHELTTDEKKNFPLVNPKRKDSVYPFPEISGVTVAFKFGWYIATNLLALKNNEWESIIDTWYPLILLGTYADRVPLRDENLSLARLGLQSLQKTERSGIKILREMLCKKKFCDEIMLQKTISVLSNAKTKGWGENIGFRILTETNSDYLYTTIAQLLLESEKWHSLANKNFRKIVSFFKQKEEKEVIFHYVPEIPYDFLGFCTSRLKEMLSRPVVLMTDKDNIIIGEARAPQEFNIHEILSKQENLFLSFGGHKPACGFKMEKKNIEKLKRFFTENYSEITGSDTIRKEMRIIDILPLEKITMRLKDEIMLLLPFGTTNPPPLFLARNLSFANGAYSYVTSETGKTEKIEMKNDNHAWVGIGGKPVALDIVYYINSFGFPSIADARPSIFNESVE